MHKAVLVFPVLPGQDAKRPARMLEERPREYRESREAVGITLERVYEMKTPNGDFAIAYLETERDSGETIGRLAQSDRPVDREFIRLIKEIHGFDPAQPPQGEPPELLADWVADDRGSDRKRGLAFCAPVMPGATDYGRTFAKDSYGRKEFAESRRSIGGQQETVMLNHTPMGDVICVYVEGADPVGSNRQFAESRTPFDTWFKDECKKIFPPEVDFNEPLPPIKEIFDSQRLLVAR